MVTPLEKIIVPDVPAESNRPARRYRRRDCAARLAAGALDQLLDGVRRWKPGSIELNLTLNARPLATSH